MSIAALPGPEGPYLRVASEAYWRFGGSGKMEIPFDSSTRTDELRVVAKTTSADKAAVHTGQP